MPEFVSVNPGGVVELSDGTFLRVAPDHLRIVTSWKHGDPIVLYDNPNMRFRTRLVNEDTKEEVGATPTQVRF
jgi:hypothetical protein